MNRIMSGVAMMVTSLVLGAAPSVDARPEGQKKQPGSKNAESKSTREATGKGVRRQGRTDSVSDSQLQEYAATRKDIEAITRDHRQKMKEKELTPRMRASLNEEYRRKVGDAIDEHGFTTESYNDLKSRVITEPRLRQRAQQVI